MFNLGGAAPVDFVPDAEAREWIALGLRDHVARLGAPALSPGIVTDTGAKPRDLDDLFELLCGVQARVGQADVELTVLEMTATPAGRPAIPPGFVPLGDPQGQLMHTFGRDRELLVVVAPNVFRVGCLALAATAREIGRIGVHRAGGHRIDDADREADAELAAVALGLGVWVANGAYVFENACCGGGCGVDLRSLRTGLSMTEACFALALDGHRRGVSRRAIDRHLDATQRAAHKTSWRYLGDRDVPELRALATAPDHPALGEP
jgi:hypothetical protein